MCVLEFILSNKTRDSKSIKKAKVPSFIIFYLFLRKYFLYPSEFFYFVEINTGFQFSFLTNTSMWDLDGDIISEIGK